MIRVAIDFDWARDGGFLFLVFSLYNYVGAFCVILLPLLTNQDTLIYRGGDTI